MVRLDYTRSTFGTALDLSMKDAVSNSNNIKMTQTQEQWRTSKGCMFVTAGRQTLFQKKTGEFGKSHNRAQMMLWLWRLHVTYVTVLVMIPWPTEVWSVFTLPFRIYSPCLVLWKKWYQKRHQVSGAKPQFLTQKNKRVSQDDLNCTMQCLHSISCNSSQAARVTEW